MKRKTRMTHAKRIASQPDTSLALEVAAYGQVLSPIERSIRYYLLFRDGKSKAALRASLGKALLKAIDSGDAEFFRGVAGIVERIHEQPCGMGSHQANIIALKGALDGCGQSMTIRRLANLLGVHGGGEDGFRALRSLCKALRFPIREGKRGPKPDGAKQDA